MIAYKTIYQVIELEKDSTDNKNFFADSFESLQNFFMSFYGKRLSKTTEKIIHSSVMERGYYITEFVETVGKMRIPRLVEIRKINMITKPE